MTALRRTAFLLGLLVLALAPAFAQDAFHLKDGDRVVFYGDSITDQRLYTTFAETFVLTRFPDLRVDFVHSGWGGDRVTGGGGGPIERRLRRDVFAYKPTVMTIMLGMNDGSYRAFDQGIFATYSNGLRDIVRSVKTTVPGIRLTLIQPSPFDDITRKPNFDGGYNAVLVRYGEFVKQLAQSERLGLADLNAPVVAALKKANAEDAERAARIIPDRVHPGAGGHLLMAGELLKSWKAPAVVTSVEIDAAGPRATGVANTDVGGLEAGRSGLRWTQADGALPMPVNMKDPVIALAVRSSDFTETLNRQMLKVSGLKAGRYRLSIDAEEVGSFSAQELAAGVNLAVLPTPMAKQAEEVHALTIQHNNIHYSRWRQVEVPLAGQDFAQYDEAMAELDRLEAEIVGRQRAAAKPKVRRYELQPE